ncbi:MAG TPA: hypothetical protein VNQ81_14900 [Povalibacter sp.]|nr:hypothetical protein [Povalibacter sp.]
MFTAEIRRHPRQRFVCLVLAVFVVTSSLSLGALGTQLMVRNAQVAAQTQA